MIKKNIIFLLMVIALFGCRKSVNRNYINIKGSVFGTFYSITYLHPDEKDLQEEIESRLKEFDNSLSTFNHHSIITGINNNDTSVITDKYFNDMYYMAKRVSEKTNGAFDITVTPLVNGWGFGTGNYADRTQPNVDSLLQFVGYNKIDLIGNRIRKKDKRIMLDASAIAKGQGCDVVAELLESKECANFMVEIGGEVVCRGINPNGEKWRIGIDMPLDDPLNENQKLDTIVSITDAALATSGNYRQFYYKDGKKYAHTIDPRTGFPVCHNLLSVTVIAPTCIEADALATAFMVLGADSSLVVCNSLKNVACYLIYENQNGNYSHKFSEDFRKYLP